MNAQPQNVQPPVGGGLPPGGPPPPPVAPPPPVVRPPPVSNNQQPQNPVSHLELLRLRADQVRVERSVIDLRQAPAPVQFQFENDTLSWLTYESIYNDEKFTHTDEVRPMGIYEMPLDNLRIIIASNVADDDTRLNDLRALFFKGDLLSNEKLRTLLYRPWDAPDARSYDANWLRTLPYDLDKIVGIKKARLPYNVVANTVSAKCLGARHTRSPQGSDPENGTITTTDDAWEMWQTASRSCFIRPRAPGTPRPNGLPSAILPNGDWNYIVPEANIVPANTSRPAVTGFNILNKNQCYSVKTGVVMVGKDNQGASKVNNMGNKATLEPDAIVATLRTEFMLAMDRYYEAKNNDAVRKLLDAKDSLVILPEVLAVTCLKAKIIEDGEEVNVINDGFQVRGLSRLNENMRYFPALSAFYVKGFGNLTTYQSHQDLDERGFKVWKEWWTGSYAGRIGEVKAKLHILYGFSPLTPNMQNFVFEVDPKNPTRFHRVILRDVLDYRLHTSWIRLILSAKGNEERALQTSLCDRAVDFTVDPSLPTRIQKLFQYEAATRAPTADAITIKLLSTSETGVYNPLDFNDLISVGQQHAKKDWEQVNVVKPGEVLVAKRLQYYSGLQLNFFAYSAPYRGDRIETQDVAPKEWKRSYAAMVDWGLEHASAFVDTVNQLLSTSSTPIKLKYGGRPITKDLLDDLKVKPYYAVTEKPNPNADEKTALSLKDLRLKIDSLDTRESLTAIHKQLIAWDFFVSGIIEEGIYKDAIVRKRLRDFLRS